MSKKLDLVGKVFGRLTVLREVPKKTSRRRWLCLCACGNETEVDTLNLRNGGTRSCGCFLIESRAKGKHGQCRHKAGQPNNHSGTPEYRMFCHAKENARKQGVPFSIELSDIVFPEFCPIFNTPLNRNNTKTGNDSPSLDKLIPKLGYVKGNINVISYKANRIKSDASLEELTQLLDWLQKKIEEKEATDAGS